MNFFRSQFSKSLIAFLLIVVFVVSFIPAGIVNAQNPAGVNVYVTGSAPADIALTDEQKREAARIAREETAKARKEAVFNALTGSLSYLMNTIAFDVATWIASGGEGQQPLFHTEGWGAYLKNVGDAALGGFISDLGAGVGLDVCNIDASLRLRIGLAIGDSVKPRQPRCQFSQIANNLEAFATDPNFLDRFSFAFDPTQNDIGASLTIFGKAFETSLADQYAAEKDREEGGGFLPVLEKVSNFIKTPATLVAAQITGLTVEELTQSEKHSVQFGQEVILQPINTFVSTLAGKYFERVLKEGLSNLSGGGSSGSSSGAGFGQQLLGLLGQGFRNNNSDSSLYNETAVVGVTGREVAEARFSDLLQAGSDTGEPYDIMSELASCVDPEDPGPSDCIVKPEFRKATDRNLTVRQAVAAGYLDGDLPFGTFEYNSASIHQGIPYRSIVALRTHRIVPVGWELAAQANHQFEPSKIYNLIDMMNFFDDPDSLYYGLVDPNWVLTAPEHLCTAEGFGPKILFEDIIGGNDANQDGDFNDPDDVQPENVVARAEYCADVQTCIDYNDDGTCRTYGYCNEERPIWDLQGDSCPAEFNTCQTYQATDGSVASYLKNSLDFNGCSIDNAGCQWYCQNFNEISNVWTCTNEGENVRRECQVANGCNVTGNCVIAAGDSSCIDISGGTNVVVDQTCNSGSQFWDGEKCVINSACTIERGGVECTVAGCSNLDNFAGNGSFEVAPGDDSLIADGWVANPAYFDYIAGSVNGGNERVSDGNRGIRYFNVGSSNSSETVGFADSSLVLLPPGDYTFSVDIFNSLNAGTITARVYQYPFGGITTIVLNDIATSTSSVKNDWQTLSRDFTVLNTGTVRFDVLIDGAQVSGTAWIDNVRITQKCAAENIKLAFAGDVEVDESKLHFDRDVQQCDPSQDGCSAFIRTLPNIGTNLVPNSSFENWPSLFDIPPGWIAGEQVPNPEFERSDDAAVGRYSLKLYNTPGTPREFSTEVLDAVKANTTYRVSFWAKSDRAVSPSEQSWYVELLSDSQLEVNSNGTYQHFCSLDPTQWCDSLAPAPGGATACPANKGDCAFDFEYLMVNNDSRFLPLTTEWQRFTLQAETTRISSFNFKFNIANLSGDTETPLYIDGVQIEEVSTADPIVTNYKNYGAANVVHLKKAPDYLSCTGDPATDPSECANYAFTCEPEEVGCEAYAPVAGGPVVPGIISSFDLCPLECVGYDAYKQSTTFFESEEALAYFIPRTATQCTAAQTGCDEFTNLDEVASGGEGREYYKALRLCELPEDSTANCQNFFAWQGSDETGFQLNVVSFSTDGSGLPREAIPAADIDRWPDEWTRGNKTLVDGRPEACNGPEDLESNPFCREFFDSSGTAYYYILENTIACSDDCHPFRKTRLGESDFEAEANCTGSNGTWQNGACIYNAIPSQGVACSVTGASCREYVGNSGANVYTAFSDNFEDGDIRNWRLGDISTESLSLGGHSIKAVASNADKRISTMRAVLPVVCSEALPACNNTTTVDCFNPQTNTCVAQDDLGGDTCTVGYGEQQCSVLDDSLIEGRSYVLTFWARSADLPITAMTVDINNGAGVVGVVDPGNTTRVIGTVTLQPSWQYYTVGPFEYDEELANPSARLRFIGPNTGASASLEEDFFIDNIEVREITGRVYVKKNSWNTPASCDQNPNVSPSLASPQYMLGCSQYTDSRGQLFNLKSFTSLCRERAVGCEALIDTYNSSSPFEEVFNLNDSIGEIVVPEDSITYLTNRAEFACNSGFQGCQAVGLPSIDIDDQVVGYQTQYLINDPDDYDRILCGSDEVGCEEYSSSNGFAYFKDPRQKICRYKQIPNQSNFGWFKVGSTSIAPDCPIVDPALGEVHPTDGFAGLCSSEYSSCTQFVDPVSNIARNLLFNGDFTIDVDNANGPDGWLVNEIPPATNLVQPLNFEADTLYTLSFTADVTKLQNTNNFFVAIRECESDDTIIRSFDQSLQQVVQDDPARFNIPQQVYANDNRDAGDIENLPDIRSYSGRFVLNRDDTCSIRIGLDGAAGYKDITNIVEEVAVRKAGVYYTLEETVDKLSCNGVVDPLNGCVLFNDRSTVNYNIGEDDASYLTFDADVSGARINQGLGVTDCGSAVCDSNAILKVASARTCESWLYCNTYTTIIGEDGIARNHCSSIGLCDRLDENGLCSNPIAVGRGDQRADTYQHPDQIANLSGYSNPGYQFSRGVCVDPPTLAGTICQTANDCNPANADSCDKTISGYFPYAEMTQEGSAAKVPNGNFEFSFGDTPEPVGWAPVDHGSPGVCVSLGKENQPCQSALDCDAADPNSCNFDNTNFAPIQWLDFKFRIDRDISLAIEGSGYLRLNTFYEAVSEEIDVEPGIEYVLSAKVNTSLLEHPSGLQQAAILIKAENSAGNFISFVDDASCTLEIGNDPGDLWNRCLPLVSNAGTSWKTLSFVLPATDATTLILKLSNGFPTGSSNTPGIQGCLEASRYNLDSSCELSGRSLWDEVAIKPVLRVDNDPLQNFVSRSCRIYPTIDSLSCNYSTGDAIYFGEFGYCVTVDPNNPEQCLQWWPVDQLAGETPDDIVAGYNDRIPLDYCTEFAGITAKLNASGSLNRIGGNTQLAQGVGQIFTDSGSELNFAPFNINPDYQAIFREPYVRQIDFTGSVLAVEDGVWFTPPFTFEMRKDEVCYQALDIFGGILGFLGGDSGCAPGDFSCIDDPDAADLFGEVSDLVNTEERGFSFQNGKYCRSIGPEEEWGGWAAIPICINVGSLVSAPINIGICIPIPISWEFGSGSLGELIPVATSFVNGEFYEFGAIGPPFGARIVTDQDDQLADSARDPIPDLGGDILGAAWFLRQTNSDQVALTRFSGRFKADVNVNYCSELVRVATSAGTNKAFVGRVESGSGYLNNDEVVRSNSIWNPVPGSPGNRRGYYTYYNPFDFQSFVDDPLNYQSSDYQPFGAIVAPSDSQFPTAWDSKSGLHKQPLFYEPPRLGFDPPYQARMGELHSADGLQQLFAKSYGVWEWVWRDPARPDLGGGYVNGGTETDTQEWDLPNVVCIDHDGDGLPERDDPRPVDPSGVVSQSPAGGPFGDPEYHEYCFVRPRVSNIKINSEPDVGGGVITNLFGGVGSARLEFNLVADPNQIPITNYVVDWGDGRVDAITGVELRSRPLNENPFILTHLYDYWELLREQGPGSFPGGVTCDEINGERYCDVRVSIRATDNWGKTTCRDFSVSPSGPIQTDDADCGDGNVNFQWIISQGSIRVWQR